MSNLELIVIGLTVAWAALLSAYVVGSSRWGSLAALPVVGIAMGVVVGVMSWGIAGVVVGVPTGAAAGHSVQTLVLIGAAESAPVRRLHFGTLVPLLGIVSGSLIGATISLLGALVGMLVGWGVALILNRLFVTR